MPKRDAGQLLTLARRDDLAFEAILLQANFNTVFCQNKQGLIGLDQSVFQLGVNIERLVGGKRPWRRSPDYDHAFFLWQVRDAKRLR